jgi:hypothetical protein
VIYNLLHDSVAISRALTDNSFIYPNVGTSYTDILIKNMHLILDMIQWIMDFPVIENEKFCTTKQVQYNTLSVY